jgi:matrix metalloproteinase-14 (membrane-inserted)
MSPANVDGEIARAFQMWANVTDLTFVHVNNQSADVDIDILYVY